MTAGELLYLAEATFQPVVALCGYQWVPGPVVVTNQRCAACDQLADHL